VDNSDALSAIVEGVQEDHYSPGIWDEIILPWTKEPTQRLETSRDGNAVLLEPFTSTSSRVTVLEVLIHAVGKERDKITRADQMAVARCLAHDKWVPNRDGNRRWYEKTTPSPPLTTPSRQPRQKLKPLQCSKWGEFDYHDDKNAVP
jgi:hypothetical protein